MTLIDIQMKEFFKKIFIRIPALIVVVAGIVLTCSCGSSDSQTSDSQTSAETVTQSQDESGAIESVDPSGLSLGDGSDEIATVDAGGEWN